MFVLNRMTKNPAVIEPETTIDAAAAFMKKNNVRRLPVVKDGRLVGFLTKNDIAKVAPSPATTLSK